MENTKFEKSIDVIIPVYNGEEFILDAIKSVEAQTIKPNNIFIIDDGSTDNTANIIENYIKISNSPITFVHKENGGPNSARNKGLSLSKTDYVAFLDADDTWIENKLEKQLEVFNTSTLSNLGLVYSDYNPINSNNNILDIRKIKIDKNFRGNAFKQVLSANKIIGSASSALIKREVFSVVGLFDEKLRFSEDWDMWIRISEKYDIDFSNEILVNIRTHKNNTTKNIYKNFLGEIDFFEKWTLKTETSQIPKEWRDRIIVQIIRRLPKMDFIKKIKQRMSPTAFNKLFPNDITYFYMFSFVIKKITQHIIK